jgi:glucose-6-phosphate 1-dehydrogenase
MRRGTAPEAGIGASAGTAAARSGPGNIDVLVIFGATGDLAKIETFPALLGMVERGALTVPVVAVANSGWSLDQFRRYAVASLKLNSLDPASPAATRMLGLLRYVDGDLDDPTTYRSMSAAMGESRHPLYYLEVPPSLFGRIAEGIAAVGRAADGRIMVEKPFGSDLASAIKLNETMHRYFPEDSVYRVDHWLGLEPVENLVFVRFANTIIEPLLCRTYVASIQITMAEEFGVAARGSFYDKAGAIRDVLQNHILQVLAILLAEPPDSRGLAQWRESKSQIIGALEPLGPRTTVRGQYEGYLDVPGVAIDSTTETFVSVRLNVKSWRWADVPIVIRVGKCLPVTATDVVIRFRPRQHNVFGASEPTERNQLRVRISPDDQVSFTILGKKPGPDLTPEARDLAFAGPTMAQMMRPYDRLIGAAMSGERRFFAGQDAIEAAWRVVQPVLGDVVPARPYRCGSWGPPEADALLPPGETWHDPT